MKINKGTVERYLEDTYRKIEIATEAEKLKMVRDMALRAIYFCYRAEIIKEIDRDKYLVDLEEDYKNK